MSGTDEEEYLNELLDSIGVEVKNPKTRPKKTPDEIAEEKKERERLELSRKIKAMEDDDSDDVIVNFVEPMDGDDFNASSRSKSRSAAKTRRRESEVEQTRQAEPKPELSKEEAKIEELKVQEDSQPYEEDEAESKAEADVELKAEPELKAKPEAGLNLDAFDPDFDEPNLTKEEEERLSNMNLDGLLEEVANSSQDLFSDEDKELLGDEIEKKQEPDSGKDSDQSRADNENKKNANSDGARDVVADKSDNSDKSDKADDKGLDKAADKSTDQINDVESIESLFPAGQASDNSSKSESKDENVEAKNSQDKSSLIADLKADIVADSEADGLEDQDLKPVKDEAAADKAEKADDDLEGAESLGSDEGLDAASKTKKEKKLDDKELADSKQELKKIGKKKKKGLFSVLKNIFFEDLEGDMLEEVDSDSLGKTLGELSEGALDEESGAKKKKKKSKADKQGEEKDPGLEDDAKEKPLDENEQLLEEMYGDKDEPDGLDAAPKKGLIAKIKYRLAQIKAKNAKEEALEEEAEKADDEENEIKKKEKKEAKAKKKEEAKAKKAEKPKKEKKQKPKKEKKVKVKPEPKPGDILKIKPVSMIKFFVFLGSLIALFVFGNKALHYTASSSQASFYYQNGQYAKAYHELSGTKLSKNEQELYTKIRLIMYVQQHYDSYETYKEMGMKTEALNELILGLEQYDAYIENGRQNSVGQQMDEARNKILEELNNSYSLSETQAKALIERKDQDFVAYYRKIEDISK